MVQKSSMALGYFQLLANNCSLLSAPLNLYFIYYIFNLLIFNSFDFTQKPFTKVLHYHLLNFCLTNWHRTAVDGLNIVDPVTDQTSPYMDCFDQAQGLWIHLNQYSITKKKEGELRKEI